MCGRELWEQWPGRNTPKADPPNMFTFYNWLISERPNLARFKRTATDECWQKIKYWLMDYEKPQGRDIHVSEQADDGSD